MTEIRSTRNGKTASVSAHLAKQLVAGGKYEYLTRELRPETPKSAVISPITGKPKRQYKRRDLQPREEE
jgi:hypothetical protein